ncbi:MAG: hypothetical protein LUG99_07215 [Lachnospiraceae bacterium]|nr:hypothetical protein [Lachnospiraceae bacterium]
MKELFKNEIPFQQVWLYSIDGKPLSEMGVVYAEYHDGWKANFTVERKKFCSMELMEELYSLNRSFQEEIPDFSAFKEFCTGFAQKADVPENYNVYFTGEYGYYWFRLKLFVDETAKYILHCYSREEMKEFEEEYGFAET